MKRHFLIKLIPPRLSFARSYGIGVVEVEEEHVADLTANDPVATSGRQFKHEFHASRANSALDRRLVVRPGYCSWNWVRSGGKVGWSWIAPTKVMKPGNWCWS
jgi:hypothetical protein